jgi:hypothetical protein
MIMIKTGLKRPVFLWTVEAVSKVLSAPFVMTFEILCG